MPERRARPSPRSWPRIERWALGAGYGPCSVQLGRARFPKGVRFRPAGPDGPARPHARSLARSCHSEPRYHNAQHRQQQRFHIWFSGQRLLGISKRRFEHGEQGREGTVTDWSVLLLCKLRESC